jgi:diguanylate cyclase (GGDEF)-like protein/PAS domain S-box-containing protein
MQQLLATLSHVVGRRMQDAPANDALLRSMQPHLPEHINNVTVWTRAGENIGSLEPGLRAHSFSIADRKYFQEALHAQGLVVEAPIISRSNGEAIAVFAFPMFDGRDVVGVVAASTRLRPLQALLDPRGGLPRDAVVTVIDSRGVMLSRSLEPEKWIGRTVPPGSAPARLQQRAGSELIKSVDGVERVFGFAAARAVAWLVYVGVPTDAALAMVKTRLYEDLALGATLLLIGLILAAWVSERISRSLRRLGNDAATLGRGDLSHRSRLTMGGEIGVLAGTLNRMAEALQERSAALRRSEQRLRQVTDNLPALVSYLDREQRFRFANRTYFDWLGVEPDSLIGRSLREFYGDETYERLRSHIESALAGAKVSYEREMATPRGVRHVQVTLVPDVADDGDVLGLYAMIQDLTERREVELKLVRGEERLSLALEGSGLSLFDWDIAADRIHYSAQASVLRGGPPVETNATPAEMRAYVHADDLPTVLERLRAAVKGTTPLYHVEYRVRTLSGGWIWLRSRGRVVERDANGRALRLAGTDADVTQRKLDEERLRQQAERDSLTGLPNRALFHDRLQKALARAARSGQPLALMFLDVDHFKRINDSLGHEAGDRLLIVFAQRMRQALRTSDTVARLAGDDFTVIVEGLRSPADARALAEKLVEVARQPVELSGRAMQVSTSVGIALSLAGETDGAALLRRADAALYEAKRRGRDGYWVDGDGIGEDERATAAG